MKKLFLSSLLIAFLSACVPASPDAGKPVIYRAPLDDIQQAILRIAPNQQYNRDLATLQLESVKPGEIIYRLDNAQNIGSLLFLGRIISRAVFTLYNAGGVTYVTGSGDYKAMIDFVFRELDKQFTRVTQP